MRIQQCPNCGEQEELRGTRRGQFIDLVCETCGERWRRALYPQCATCGGSDLVQRPQIMTGFSRGNQLSVLGWRNIDLCAQCDREAIERSMSCQGPVPEGYRAAAVQVRH